MYDELIRQMKANGVHDAAVIAVTDIPFDPELRKMCEANRCGNYGKSWTCPPDAGAVEDLISHAKTFQYGLVYNTVTSIEDSFDIEGMREGGKLHRRITDAISPQVAAAIPGEILQLSAGGCPVCERCAKKDGLPCRHPDEALFSLETYGIYVSKLAENAGMKYINGVNTITYFGAFLFH